MRAEDKAFSYIAGPTYYDIPFFQRAYVWNEDNWAELFENLTNTTSSHFLGSIILKSEELSAGQTSRFMVIDGQQRLTTLSILLRACFDHIVANQQQYGLSDDLIMRNRSIMEELLYVVESSFYDRKYIKINHSHLDREAYERTITGFYSSQKDLERIYRSDSERAIVRAYAYFRLSLEKSDKDCVVRLWDLLATGRSSILVWITLNYTDNEQAIFDTVNTAGVRLSSADTIKNLLFQKYEELLKKENEKTADEIAVKEYESTWEAAFLRDDAVDAYWSTEHQYGRMMRSNLETFLHAFAVSKEFFNAAENLMTDLPKKYKCKVESMGRQDLELFLAELRDYANVFRDFFLGDAKVVEFTDRIERLLSICASLEVSTFYPYILKQLYMGMRGEIDNTELEQRLFALEKYIILNAICKGSTKNYNNECMLLVGFRRTPEELLNDNMYITEQAFTAGLRRMTTNKLPSVLLFWIELFKRNKSNVDFKRLVYGYTLEHIMPQKWQQSWADIPIYDTNGDLIEDKDEIARIRGNAIYEIGNMTLLNSKLNTSVSNSEFNIKVDGKKDKEGKVISKGMKDLADLLITREVIKNHTSWTESEIYARSEELENYIREIWDVHELREEKIRVPWVPGELKKLQKEYWELALPKIREELGDNAPFSNVNPSSDSWRAGYMGVGGFMLRCAITEVEARAEVVFGSSDVEKNMIAFNTAHDKREEIETAMGTKLTWSPSGNGRKAASIIVSETNMSIMNRQCWDEAADFHAQWMKAFCDVLLPYIKPIFPGLSWSNPMVTDDPDEFKGYQHQ